MPTPKCKVIFFGTPEVAVPVLEALTKANFCDVVAVVTQPDKAIGRHHSKKVPSPVKEAAQSHKIEVLEGLSALGLSNNHPLPLLEKEGISSLGIVVAYGEILPKWLLDHFPLGILNIHPSLLPKYRGPSPIQAAILDRDQETGVSIIKLDEEMDHGPIIAQEIMSLVRNDKMTAGELGEYLFKIGAELLIKVLPHYIAGKITPRPQDDSLASYTKKLTKEDGKIDWSRPAEEIDAHIRAMNPWPGAWMEWKGKRLIVWRASLLSSRPKSREAGRVEGSLIQINYDIQGIPPCVPRPPWADSGLGRNDIMLEEVQLEGKKKMSFKEFLKGHPDFPTPNASGGITSSSSSR